MNETESAFKAIITGRVQGVGYRMFARQHALSLGLSGHVRNLPGSDVEVLAVGQKRSLLILLDRLRSGPPAARVQDVEITWHGESGAGEGFQIIP